MKTMTKQDRLYAAMIAEEQKESDAYIKRWTAFMRKHMLEYDKTHPKTKASLKSRTKAKTKTKAK